MLPDPSFLRSKALGVLQGACCPEGILASPAEQENYRRIWARDAVVAGIAGILADDTVVMEGLHHSLRTLAEYQHPRGMIPSNVAPDETDAEVSYGGLAGRVDATTWFVVGCGLYLQKTGDEMCKKELQPNLEKALTILDQWEFNAGDLLYTPLSGNWADEYPVQGHTLYDNALRLWALEQYAVLYDDEERKTQARCIRHTLRINFWPDASHTGDEAVYHPRAYGEAAEAGRPYFSCALGPDGHDLRFDAAGNALAVLINLADAPMAKHLIGYADSIFEETGRRLLPAFWPVIHRDDNEWERLRQNYSYTFKNKPHHFHNGGIWPVWMGLFALALRPYAGAAFAEQMVQSWREAAPDEEHLFAEYIASDTGTPGGKEPLCYSAAGLIFLLAAMEETPPELFNLNTP